MTDEELFVGAKLPISERANECRKFYRTLRKYNLALEAKYKNRYDWSKAYYIDELTPIKVCCKSHGFFKMTPKELTSKRSKGCPTCTKVHYLQESKKYKGQYYTRDRFIAEATKINGHKFDYSSTLFTSFNDPVTVKCKVHGYKTYKNPALHLEPTVTCAACKGSLSRHTTEDFVAKAKEIHGTKYDYSNTIYTTSRAPISITCPEHGPFTLSQASFHTLSGVGCRECSPGGFNPKLPGILYYLSIDNGQAYKIGITNHSVEARFAQEDLSRIKTLKTWYYVNGKEANNKETEILREYKQFKYEGVDLLKNGNTELFKIDILGLDSY